MGTTFTQYGITDFEVQYWTGSQWMTLPGGNVTGNNKVWRQITFTPVATTKVRVLVNGSLRGYSRIAEVEAWGTDSSSSTASNAPVDFNGDGKTDFVLAREASESETAAISWRTLVNGVGELDPVELGIATDLVVSGDFDGDGKDDVAAYRGGSPTSTFLVIDSSTNTFRSVDFGQEGDDPRIVGDYTGDGVDDFAVYRPGAQSQFLYMSGSNVLGTGWGQTGDVPVPGDFDGDGKYDFAFQRGNVFHIRLNGSGTMSQVTFGGVDDIIVPADYDGDGITDIAVVRVDAGSYEWSYIPSSDPGNLIIQVWGNAATDIPVPGDYNGDGRADFAVWQRTSIAQFAIKSSSDGATWFVPWGEDSDFPVAAFSTSY